MALQTLIIFVAHSHLTANTTLWFKKIAYAHYKQDAMDSDEEIIPTAVIIKNIPLHWEPGRLLQLMSQMELPPPIALNYLYNNLDIFRGMAFASFASSDNTRQVVQELNHHRVSGRSLTVQHKRKRPGNLARENPYRRTTFQPSLYSHTEARDEARDNASIHPQTKVSSAPRLTRQQTPPSGSYNLLMSYQKNPVEKEKLKRFLAQTGDFQEAVNEFAKNRVQESDDEGYQEGMEKKPILEMRPATAEELEQIAATESRFGLGGQASSCGSFIVEHEGEQDRSPERAKRATEKDK